MRSEDIPYDTTARDKRAAARVASKGARYDRGARQVAAKATGLELKNAQRSSIADDFGDGSADYVTRGRWLPAPLAGRFDEAMEANAMYLSELAKARARSQRGKATAQVSDPPPPSVTIEIQTDDDDDKVGFTDDQRRALARRFRQRAKEHLDDERP